MTGLYTFVKKQKTIPFPKQSLNPRRGLSTEKEQSVWDKETFVILLFNDGSQGINTKA